MLEVGSTCWTSEVAPRASILVDMEPYLAAARAAFRSARSSIHFLNWAFDPDTVLDHEPDGPGSAPLTIGSFLRGLIDERPDLEVRILCWASPLPVAATQRFFPHRSRKFFASTRVRFVLDDTVPLGASHHQKVVIVDDALAFCGSCDIGPDRWDSPDHLHPDPRREKLGRARDCYDCRHEVMAMMDGPPAASLGNLFRERWERATGERLPAGAMTSRNNVWPDEVSPDFRKIRVGLSRTQASWKDFPELREGESATLAAIASARSTLYFENQYFTSPIVAEALAQRLQEADGPEVVLVSTRHSPSWFDQMTMDKTRSRFLERLERADRHGRFHAYSPVTANDRTIIVHAKLSIVDDRLVRIGSSNVNNRSEGFDSECDVTFDSDCSADANARCVSVFRARLLAHWLGCNELAFSEAYDQVGSVGGAVEHLRAAGHHRLQPLRSRAHGWLSTFIADHHIGDPISAADSLRPWLRPAQMRHKLAAAVHRLQRADVPAPEVPLGGPIEP